MRTSAAALWTTFKQVFSKNFAKIILSGAAGFAYYQWDCVDYTRKIDQRFRDGVVEGPRLTSHVYVQRTSELEKLASIGGPSATYYLVTGESSTGKSTLLLDFARQRSEKWRRTNQPAATIRVNMVGGTCRFAEAFAEAVGVRARPPVKDLTDLIGFVMGSVVSEEKKMSSLYTRALRELMERANALHREHPDRYTVLIIDDANGLVKTEGTNMLIQLQDLAKEQANTGVLRIVFVSSDDIGKRVLDSQGAASRMESIYVGDMTEEETKSYLSKRGVTDPARVAFMERVAGGRVGLLDQLCAKELTPLAVLQQNYFKLAEMQFAAACEIAGDRGVVIAAVRAMLKSPNRQLSAERFSEIVGHKALALYSTPGLNFFSASGEEMDVKFYAPYVQWFAETSQAFK